MTGLDRSEIVELIAARRGESSGSFVIGIGGGSGSGKSTIAARLAADLRPREVTLVNQDRFFLRPEQMPTYRSTPHDAERPNFNRPESFDRDRMIRECGRVVRSRTRPTDVIILEGILVLHFAELRALMDLRCYVSTPVEQMLQRRTVRNLAAGYGGSEEEIRWYNRECVEPEHRRFNAPSARHADLLIPNGEGDRRRRDELLAAVVDAVAGDPKG